jgi:hypothetical protein
MDATGKVYKAEVGDRVTKEGVSFYVTSGERVDVNGRVYVNAFGGGCLIPADGPGWRLTPTDAKRDAATRAREMAAVLTLQAAKLEVEADAADAAREVAA